MLKYLIATLIILLPVKSFLKETDVEKHMGNDGIQGLHYVNNASKDFMKIYNNENKTKWRALQPDVRIIVEKCIVPFKISWLSSYSVRFPVEKYWYIKVVCEKTVGGSNWDVIVPTNRPLKK